MISEKGGPKNLRGGNCSADEVRRFGRRIPIMWWIEPDKQTHVCYINSNLRFELLSS